MEIPFINLHKRHARRNDNLTKVQWPIFWPNITHIMNFDKKPSRKKLNDNVTLVLSEYKFMQIINIQGNVLTRGIISLGENKVDILYYAIFVVMSRQPIDKNRHIQHTPWPLLKNCRNTEYGYCKIVLWGGGLKIIIFLLLSRKLQVDDLICFLGRIFKIQ